MLLKKLRLIAASSVFVVFAYTVTGIAFFLVWVFRKLGGEK